MKISINEKAYDKAIKFFRDYANNLEKKQQELLERLAFLGATRVSLGFSRAIYGDDIDVKVDVQIKKNKAIIRANGQDVCFIEFGAGIRYGNGYPSNRPEGIVGIGEYGKGHGNDPKGWWYTGKDGSSHHSYGNPPNAVMYNTSLELAEEISKIAREVFKW